jgi:uncharacterized protein YybS (DUF2232 family)
MSFENPNNIKKKRANLAVLIMFTVAATLVTVFVPFISFAGFAFLAVPTTLLFISKRYRDALICAVAGVLLLFIFNYVIALVVLIIVAAVCFDYRYIIKSSKSATFTIFTLFGIFFSSVVLFFLIDSAISQQNSFTALLSGYNDYIANLQEDPLLKSYQVGSLIGSSQIENVIKQTQELLSFVPKIMPGILFVFFSSVAVLNYYFSQLFFKRFDVEIEPLPEFKQWDLSWYWCWGVIAGIALVIIPSFNGSFDSLIDIIGFNLIIVFGYLYMVLGAAALWGWLERVKVSPNIRIVILVALFVLFGFFIILPVFGLIDIWANFRKLKRTH